MPSEEQDPKVLYLYLSLSSGSSTIDTGLRVLDRILKANKIPYHVIDVATDDRARSIWTRRKTPSQKLPALVKDGNVIGDFTEVEEWNEYGELKWKLGLEPGPGSVAQGATTTSIEGDKSTAPKVPATSTSSSSKAAAPKKDDKKPEAAAPVNPMAANLATEAAAAANKKKEAAASAAKKVLDDKKKEAEASKKGDSKTET